MGALNSGRLTLDTSYKGICEVSGARFPGSNDLLYRTDSAREARRLMLQQWNKYEHGHPCCPRCQELSRAPRAARTTSHLHGGTLMAKACATLCSCGLGGLEWNVGHMRCCRFDLEGNIQTNCNMCCCCVTFGYCCCLQLMLAQKIHQCMGVDACFMDYDVEDYERERRLKLGNNPRLNLEPNSVSQ